MRKFKSSLIVFALLIILGQLILIYYSDLSWINSAGSYLGIFAMICVIISMLLSNRHEQKKVK
jgi:hypothetical protein